MSFDHSSARATRRRAIKSLASIALASIALCMVTQSTSRAAQSSTPSAATGANRTLLVLGDSISAEYGLKRDSGWVKLLEARLQKEGFAYPVVNASISGETTSGGVARVDELLTRLHPAIVIVELGGNDGLRGLPLSATEQNLGTIITRSQKAGASVLLIGMQLPPNYGKSYIDRFAAIYATAARRYKTAFTPFFFEGFADRYELFQPDRIHPTEAAQARLLDKVWPALRPLLKQR
jgi:acyl-CoA thioesterase-1